MYHRQRRRRRRRRVLCNTRAEIAAKHRDRLSRQMFRAQDAIIQNVRCASDLVFRDFGHPLLYIIVDNDDDDVGVSDFRKAIVFCIARC